MKYVITCDKGTARCVDISDALEMYSAIKENINVKHIVLEDEEGQIIKEFLE